MLKSQIIVYINSMLSKKYVWHQFRKCAKYLSSLPTSLEKHHFSTNH